AREIESQEQNVPYNALMQQMFGSNEPEVKNTRELIDTYRNLLNNYEVDNAVQEIVSDAIVFEDGKDVVALNLDATEFSQKIKDRILEEFSEVNNLLNFERK